MAFEEQIQATSSTHPEIFSHSNDLILPLRLESIIKSEGEDFIRAWLDCVKCHYDLCQSDERPTTLGLENLTFDPSADHAGAFVDWDAAVITSYEVNRTGAPPFLALDMLWKSPVPRLYRHDLESFIWILPWIFLQYEGGRRESCVLRSWEGADSDSVHGIKRSFLDRLSEFSPMSQYESEWRIVRVLLSWLTSEANRRKAEADSLERVVKDKQGELADFIKQIRSMPKVAEPEEKEPEQVYQEFWKIMIVAVEEDRESLGYAYDFVRDRDHAPHAGILVTFTTLKMDDIRKDVVSVPCSESLSYSNHILPLRLESILKLEGKDFVRAWLDCVKCHYVLSQSGERVTTLSLTSLAFDPAAGGSNILIDWDVSTPTHEEGVRTGAPAFLAMDMLGKARIPRLYRHDLEAFIWILPWVFLQFQDGRRISRVLSSWDSADYNAVRVQKSDILYAVKSELHLEKTSPFLQEWPVAKRLVYWLFCENVRRMKAERFQLLANDEKTSTRDAHPVPTYIKARIIASTTPMKGDIREDVAGRIWVVLLTLTYFDPHI
ncbi:hypothetical protein EWM64_g4981 [Hericium alpestre]|uniref:Fungal-type protein kinase domain-containing protein n=1 Tax=Hericium alpestre TaxID=135208 RepID=A0A4Y9ZW37_9AGAM|nr:hypothetical protein EWM64_g4981 [Hericium alpestre]